MGLEDMWARSMIQTLHFDAHCQKEPAKIDTRRAEHAYETRQVRGGYITPPELTASKKPADLDAAATCCSPSLCVWQELSARACSEEPGAKYLRLRGLKPRHF